MDTSIVQQFKEKHESLAGIVHLVDNLGEAAAKIISILEEKDLKKLQ